MNSCSICGSGKLSVAAQFEQYAVWECANCQYAIVDPIPDNDKLTQLYNSKEYFETHMKYDFTRISSSEINTLVNQQFQFHQNMLRGIKINPQKKMLEIGPGGGFSLDAFKNMGFQVKGIETSETATKFMREKLGLSIDNISFEEIDLESYPDGFDLIFLNHVLEHFLEPVFAMEKLRKLLAPNGILYIRVPDHDSYDRRKYGSKWPAYAYYHISNFSNSSLRKLFALNKLNWLKTEKYISEKAPEVVKKLARGPIRNWMVNRYSGRTITIIGQK